jgi:hypothetical protein
LFRNKRFHPIIEARMFIGNGRSVSGPAASTGATPCMK